MVAKKRNTMRQRAAAALKQKGAAAAVPKDSVEEQNVGDMGEDPKAFLHQLKETKKEKSLNRQQMFLDQVRQKSGVETAFAGISKSSVRRRKRKLRDDLKPKMGDLLTSLGGEEDLKEHVEEQAVIPKVLEEAPAKLAKHKNEPNIRNQRGAKALSIQESARLKQVLSNASFRQDTFGSLRDVIKMQNR